MMELNEDMVSGAQAGDADALTAVIRALEPRISNTAFKAATGAGGGSASLIEEFEQIGRIAVWTAIPKFRGATVGEFFTFIDRHIWGEIENARHTETRQGISPRVAHDFEGALTACGGDPIAAERHARSDAMGARKMSPDMAHAARLAWSGRLSLDVPQNPGEPDGGTLGESLPAELMEPKDRETERQRAIRDAVHASLGRMGAKARAILAGTYGISGPTPYFGTSADDEFGAFLGLNALQLQSQRANAKRRFRVVYLAGANGATPEGLVSE
jgi:hypothetical protein